MLRTVILMLLVFTWAGSFLCGQEGTPIDQDRLAYFETKIRPVLVEHCLECHSPESELSGSLSLDSKSGWEVGGDTGPAILPGDPDQSLLIKAIAYADPELRMPPEGKLPSKVVDDFRRWIAEGAIDPRSASPALPSRKVRGMALEEAVNHWAYRPMERPAVVPYQAGATLSDRIDGWIGKRLQQESIQANPIASREILIRRLTVDLHGLLPTPEEVESFVNDSSSDAYERLVDRLLESRRFGERMARRWLDVVRYAESLTLRGFTLPEAWRYRDYCISAFHEDMPMDQFIAEQIAGDLMSSDDRGTLHRRSVAATFWLLGNSNLEEQDKKQLEMDVVDEQLEVMGRAFLGQSIGCARCHDHKFDPIPTRDYYALAGILKESIVLEHENVSKWIELPLPLTSDEEARFAGIDEALRTIKGKLAQLDGATVNGRRVALTALEGHVVDDVDAKKVGVWTRSSSVQEYVGEGYLHDGNAERGTKAATFEPPALPSGRYEVRMAYAHGDNRSTKTMVSVFSADGESIRFIDQKKGAPIEGLWISLGEYTFEKDGQCFVIVSNEGADGHVIADAVQFLALGKTGLSVKSSQLAGVDVVSDEVKEVVRKELKAQVAKLEKEIASRPKVMGMKMEKSPKDLAIHIRGSVHTLGEIAPRGFLRLANASMEWKGSEESPPTRRELADWVVNGKNPMTGRVMVNRIWLWMMGEGLVRTIDQFGVTGESPVYPELLDDLTLQWMEEGWSVKKLVRGIVLSEAYRRTAEVSNESQRELDSENRYFGRAMRKRLDAESLRDSILLLSGELQQVSGGRTFDREIASDYGYQNGEPIRSIYLPAFRNSIPDFLQAFDMADLSVSVGKRNQTTVAQQALVMINHPWVMERCRAMAVGMMSEASSPEEIVVRASKKIWGREPKDGEKKKLVQFLGHGAGSGAMDAERVADLLQGMISTMDFRYID